MGLAYFKIGSKVICMIKLKTCDICKKKFKANLAGRLEIVKRLEKGKVEIWICPDCVPEIKKRLDDLKILK
jgi:hypothetical protein